MSAEEVPNACCWWNRCSSLCCDFSRPLKLRYDDFAYQFAHRISGVYQGGRFSRTIWNLIEWQYHKNSNSNKKFEMKDITINTEKGSGKHDKFGIRVYKPRCQTCSDESCPSCLAKRPVIMYLHGGGFAVLSAKFKGYHELCSFYATKGFIVVSVSYRLAPENPYPAAVLDCYQAMQWVFDTKVEEATTRADLSKGLVLMGDSAGGNLALGLATLVRDGLDANLNQTEASKAMNISKLILAYPVLFSLSSEEEVETRLQKEFVEEVRQNGYLILSYPIYEGYNEAYLGKDRKKRREVERTDRRVSPMLAGLNDLPPILLVTGSSDFLSIPAKTLEEKLKESNTVVDHVAYDHQPHGFFSILYLKESKAAHERCLEFLDVEQ